MVGSAVATMVWSSEAGAMPSMRAARITRIRRCSASLAPVARRSHQAQTRAVLQILFEMRDRPRGWPRLTGRASSRPSSSWSSQSRRAFRTRSRSGAGRGEADPGGPAVVGVGLATTISSRSSCWTLRVTVGASTPSISARSVIRSVSSPCRELWSGAAPARSSRTPADREPLVQADLGDRPGHDLQRLFEAVDVAGRRTRRGEPVLYSCFRHTNRIATPPEQPFMSIAAANPGQDSAMRLRLASVVRMPSFGHLGHAVDPCLDVEAVVAAADEPRIGREHLPGLGHHGATRLFSREGVTPAHQFGIAVRARLTNVNSLAPASGVDHLAAGVPGDVPDGVVAGKPPTPP